MTEIKQLSAAESAEFTKWANAIKRAAKGVKFALSDFHLLSTPSLVRMRALGAPWRKPIFNYWADGAAVEFRGTRYLSFHKGNKERVVSVLRSYSNALTQNKAQIKGEENTFTILYEAPNADRAIPPKGAGLVTWHTHSGPRIVINDEEPSRSVPHHQNQITPLGKKGVCSMHTFYQMCPTSQIRGGCFQRTFIGRTLEVALRKAGMTLRRLAEADPKSTERGIKELLREVEVQLKDTAEGVLINMEETMRATSLELLESLTGDTKFSLPAVELGTLGVEVIPDLAYGPNPLTWGVSIKVGDTKETAPELRNRFQNAWQQLS